ncbi:MAG: radical SAM protein [Polyangiaceae bacterium]|nr:radical SAM protein [Polyangiaceae bacterium]
MTRVAVVLGPLGVSRDFIDYPYFGDLGPLQATSVLCSHGLEVAVADAFALPTSDVVPLAEDEVRFGAPAAEVAALVGAPVDVLVVALSPFHRPPRRDPLLGELLVALRADHPDTPLVLAHLYQSGEHVVDAPAHAILASYPEADVLLRFEAEHTLPALCELVAGTPRREVAQHLRRALGERVEVVGGERAALTGEEPPDLDALPVPAWDLIDRAALFRFHERVVQKLGRPRWAFPIDGRTLPALTSRGCPYRCVHCSSNPASRKEGEQLHPKTQRRYSAAALDRLFGALAGLGARRVQLLDELVNANREHFETVLALLARHGLGCEIPNGVRADHLEPEDFPRLRALVTTLSVSAESGSPRVLDEVVGKRLELGTIRTAAERAAAVGLPMLVHFMIGLPGETKAEVNQTLALAIDLFEATGAVPSVQFATPLPGTRLAALARTSGARVLPLVDDWGPHFQKHPAMDSERVTAEELGRFKWTFDQRVAAASGPKKIILNATYMCNNHCTFCATGTRTQFHGDFERQRELLAHYRQAGVRLLDIDGGEPTLNPNLFLLVRTARTLGYEKVHVTTNARRAAYPGYARALVRSGVSSILCSIHGPDAQTHAQNVGVAEAFEQTCAGVRNLVALAPRGLELGANITITKSNWQKLEATAELVLSLGLRWLNLQFLTPFGRATSAVAPDTAAAAGEVRALIDHYGARMNLQIINLPFCFLPGYERYLTGDLMKLERHMLFVNNEGVNLAEYLRERRVRKPVCEVCPHAVFCGGFYEMDNAPEPTWLIDPKDLVRPLDPARLPLG